MEKLNVMKQKEGKRQSKKKRKDILTIWEYVKQDRKMKLKGNPFNIMIIVVSEVMSEGTKREMDVFFTILENVKYQSKSKEIIVKNLNAKGREKDSEMVSKYQFGSSDDHREKWVIKCSVSSQKVSNIWFEEH